MNIGDVDLTNPDSFIEAVPFDYFRFLREQAPLTFSPRASDGGFWNVVRYADITAIEKDVEGFTSRTNVSPMDTSEAQLANTIDNSIILTDPPQHGFLRGSIRDAFVPKAVKRLEESMKVYARNAIDAVIETGACDLHDVAAYTPIEVVADILGVPAHDRPKLFEWANAMFGQLDPELSDHQRATLGGFQMMSYARRVTRRRRATFIVLATAGNETTRTQYLHGMAELIARPDVMAELRADPALIPNAVEEMLRWTTPALGFARKATRDHELHGQTIRQGERVMLWYVSGNRDETVFPDPDSQTSRLRRGRWHPSMPRQYAGQGRAERHVHGIDHAPERPATRWASTPSTIQLHQWYQTYAGPLYPWTALGRQRRYSHVCIPE